MTIEESIKIDPSKFQAIIGTKETAVKTAMQDLSEKMEFEKAADYRDLLQSVRQITQKQKITDLSGDDKDIIAIARDEQSVIVQVFFVRNGKITDKEHFYMKQTEDEETPDILHSFISQYYADCPGIPKELIVSGAYRQIVRLSRFNALLAYPAADICDKLSELIFH